MSNPQEQIDVNLYVNALKAQRDTLQEANAVLLAGKETYRIAAAQLAEENKKLNEKIAEHEAKLEAAGLMPKDDDHTVDKTDEV